MTPPTRPLPDVQSVTFTVPGVPVPQGSKRLGRIGTRPVILDDNGPDLTAWRTMIGYACNRVWGNRAPLDGPVMVNLTFWLPRPSSWPGWRLWRSTKPDVDKLVRAVFDGLHIEGGVLGEDSRVVAGRFEKRVTAGQTGVEVEIVELGGMERAGFDVEWEWRFVRRLDRPALNKTP